MPQPDTSSGPVLVLNSGSSSLKFGVFHGGPEDEDLLLSGSADGIGRPDGSLTIRSAGNDMLLSQEHVLETQSDALGKLAGALAQHLPGPLIAVGHRMVHGGPHLREHCILTSPIVAQLQAAEHFAPLHIPQALALLAQAQRTFPGITQIACFDDAFHRTLPAVACRLPIPSMYFDQGVYRYGFHGLSYESLVHRLGPALPPRAVFAHLGNGSSLAAIRVGHSVDTTMGFTPTGGIPMGTRSGDLDPGVLLYLMRTENAGADALETMLNRQSGLAALSGGESDMRALLERCHVGDPAAQLAVDAFVIAVRKFIGAYAALLGGIDLLVFTGGIGEHSAEIRQRVCEGLEFLGINAAGPSPAGKVRVIEAEEERQMARHCRTLLGPAA